MSADLVFKNSCATVDYEIEPAANMTAEVVSTKDNSREYRFAMDGNNASCATGAGITIGKIVFSGYGTLDFSVDDAYVSASTNINEVHTAEIADNIVDTYKDTTLIINSDATNTAYPTTIAEDEDGTIKDTIAKETANLTINIDFPNAIVDQKKDYQNMTVTISGGDLTDNVVYDLGTDGTALNADGKYVIDVADKLTKNVAYTVKVEGAGYRTARYTVNMTGAKTLNFWNNVKDADAYIEESVGTPKNTTFLAGDIVKDNQINIYDLSAVVSYFGTNNLVSEHPEYAKYDLNRDGKIDSKDIAYVLVSWGN